MTKRLFLCFLLAFLLVTYVARAGNITNPGGGGGGSGTVTNIATSSPITGGPITSTGTIACPTCGVTGSPLSQFAATTSAQLAAVLSDETGTGVVVYSTAPTFTTNITDPLLIGGTAATSTLTLESTSGSGSGDSLIFKTGSQVTQMTIGTQTISAVLPVDLGTCTTTGTCAFTTSASAITSYIATVPSRSTGCTLSTTSSGCSGNATGDSGTFTQFTGSSTQTVTIGSTLPIGFQAAFVQIGTAAVSLSAGSGATLNTPHAFTGSTYGQYSTIGITVISNSGGSSAVAVMTGDGK